MAVYKRYLYAFPDYHEFYDSHIAMSEILCVKREGLQYDEVDTTPVGRQCQYDTSGWIRFDENIFTGEVPPGRFIPDKILVIYKQ